MDFDAILEQILKLVQSQRRVSYRAIKRRFDVADDDLEDLKEELLFAHPHIVDEEGRGLVWTDLEAQTMRSPQSDTGEKPSSSAVKTPITAPPPDAERRQLTVMFCDLVGSTQLSTQLDPEDYRDVVRAYQAVCTEAIQRFDGHVAQYLGDGLLIYFGYPQAHEDDAQRAVRAALGSLVAMESLHTRLIQQPKLQLGVRIGIHTGPVVVGEVGAGTTPELLAMGETPNIAARLQGVAEPDTVVISGTTLQLVQGYFECQTLGEHALRGVREPMAVYRVLRESGAQSRLEIAPTLTPLVGRAQEVDLLLERWSHAQAGQGQVVLLNGEAGIGKSRLVQVIKDRLADASCTRVECRSSPYYQHSALHPIIDLFHRILSWRHDEPPEAKLEKLERVLSQYRSPLSDTVPLFATLLSLPVPDGHYHPLTLTAQQQRQKTLDTLLAVVLELAEQQPVLFILEDLHWTDPTTQEFLGLLIDQAPTARLFIVLTCRPHFQVPWSSRSYLTQVPLNQLSRPDVEGMVDRLIMGKPLPPEVLEQIVEKTDGIPLFVEEWTKALLESGRLHEADDHYELTGPLPTLAIPTTLQDALTARLDRLVTAKGVAQLGATIGRQFSYTLLRAIAPLDESTLQRELVRLVEAELLYQRGVLPQTTYTFKHALIQEAAYESCLKSTRQQVHQRIAQAFEAHFPETVETRPELIAYHYTEAGQLERAVDYWYKAGQQAVAHSAYPEAIAHLSKGLQALETLPGSLSRARQELGLILTLGPALASVKGAGFQDIMHRYRRAWELCQQVGDQRQLATVLAGQRRFYVMRGDLQSALEVAEELLTVAQQLDDISLHLHALFELANGLIWMGDFVRTRAHLDQVIALSEQSSPHQLSSIYAEGDTVVLSLMQRALVLWLMGFPDQAFHSSQSALSQLHTVGHAYNQAVINNWGTHLHHYRRDAAAARRQAEAALALSLEHGIGHRSIQARMLQGWAWCVQGAIEEGLAEIRAGLTAYRATQSTILITYFLTLLAEAYQLADRTPEGLCVLQEALGQSQTAGECYWQAEIHRLEGELRLRLTIPEMSQAEHCFSQAIDVARQQQAKSLELRASMSLSRLWQQQGKSNEARKLLAPVFSWFTEGFDTADLQEAKSLLETLSS